MERRKAPYSIHKRPTKKKNRFIFYTRFRDAKTDEYMTAISTGCTRRDDAVRWCENRLRSGDTLKGSKKFSGFVAGFWEKDGQYVQGKLVRGHTISNGYREIAEGNTRNHLIPVWGEYPLRSLTAGNIDAWVIELRKESGLASATVNKLLQTLNTILDQAVAAGLISDNPARHVKPIKLTYAPRGVLTLDELRKLIGDTAAWPDLNHYCINLIAATTGLRMGEIRGLSPSNVAEDRIVVSRSWEKKYGLKDPKFSSFREIPISPYVHDVIRTVIDLTSPEDILFYGATGKSKPLHKSAIEKHFRRALVRIGVSAEDQKRRNLVFHSYRHTLNTLLRASGISDSKIKLVTGHKSAEIQDRYTHFRAGDLAEVVEVQSTIAPKVASP